MSLEPEPSTSGAARDAATSPQGEPPRVTGKCARHADRGATLQCARCGDNLCEECAAERVDGVCKACLELLSNRGRVWQVQWLAVVTMVHAGLLLFWAFGVLLSGAYMGFAMGNIEPTQPDTPPPELMAGFMSGIALFMMLGQLVPGVLQAAAGYYMLKFRYRWLAIAAYVSGLLSITGCYCLPTAILLGIWGIFILFDKDVAARFDAGT